MPRIVTTYRPCDPYCTAASVGGGWLVLNLNRREASQLVSLHEWYLSLSLLGILRECPPDIQDVFTLSNMAIACPFALHVYQEGANGAEDVQALFEQHAPAGSDDASPGSLAVLPAHVELPDPPLTLTHDSPEEDGDVDLTLIKNGVWLQLYLPLVSVTFESPVLSSPFLQQLAAADSD